MTDNLVKRLRDWEHVHPEDYYKDAGHLYEEAADRIEELGAKLANARRDGFSAGISTAMGVLMDADTIAEAGAALSELKGQGTE